MSKFKEGDRVAVYLGGARDVGPERRVGTVVNAYSESIDVALDGSAQCESWYCHPKQLRQLKPKAKKPEPDWAKVERNLEVISNCGGVVCLDCQDDAKSALAELRKGSK